MRIGLLFAATFAVLTGLAGSAQASGHIYLLKGFAGVFSTGLDTLAEQLKSRGYTATVESYSDAESLGVEAAKLQKSGKGPIIIIGHSLGADATIPMAEKMKQEGAAVALIVTFGPDYQQLAPSNVARFINYYQGTAKIGKGQGFKGTISNIDLLADADINHFNIEKIARLHAKVIGQIHMIFGRNATERAEQHVALPHDALPKRQVNAGQDR
jgi:alpha-beta hydrolase superfamily lysophospholipase